MKLYTTLLVLLIFGNSLMAQYEEDRHSTNYYDAWLSCEETPSPNEKWGDRHWIKYEFEAIYVLGQMGIWNYNDRESNGKGVRDVIIDYSTDGVTWEEWGLYTFEKAPETSFYQGQLGPDFDGLEARYLLLTVLSNYGGGPCVGIGEIKIETTGWSPNKTKNIRHQLSSSIAPNPSIDNTELSIKLNDLDDLKFSIIDQKGKRIKSWSTSPQSITHKEIIDTDYMAAGTYYLYINQKNKVSSQKLIVIKP